MEYVLASASPRRSEILQSLGLKFKILKSDAEADSNLNIEYTTDGFVKYVMSLSKLKAEDVASRLKFDEQTLIIAADTIVVNDGNILEKPKDENDAYRMLKELSGRTHSVLTGVTIIKLPEYRIISDFEKTEVSFRKLENQEILDYIKTGEPMDKAGAYGIQGKGSLLVKGISGCYFNVVGLPVNKLNDMLNKFNINLLLCNM